MAHVEDRDLEDILVKTEAPKRVEAKENIVKRVAKLTGRTISSLRTIIKENRLDKAYAKYNKKYQKMKEAAKVAATARQAKDAGEDITNSELAVEYSIVASYDKKLAKMGAKLLKDDIKKVIVGMDVSGKVSIGKRIRVPRFLLTKMQKLVKAIEKTKIKREEKKLVKEITKQTKEYIKNSLDGALFKEDGSLQEKIDPEVIKNLGLKGGKNDTERRLDTLKGFISMDGKNALFENKDVADDELEKESKSNTDLPPSEPEATVKKSEEKVNVDDLLKKFTKEEGLTKQEKWRQTFKEIDAAFEEDYKDATNQEGKDEDTKKSVSTGEIEGLNVKDSENNISKDVPVKKIDSRQQEVDAIVQCNDRISQLNAALKKAKDPDSRAILSKAIEHEKQEMEKIAENIGMKEQQKNISKKAIEEPNKDIQSENKEQTMEPIVVNEKKAEKTSEFMTNVEVKQPEQIRVSQVSKPLALRVTLQDIKKLEERDRNAQLKIAQLKVEKENLEKEKAILKEYIAKANITKASEMQARSMAEDNATLKGEIAELNSQASEIDIDLGRSK